MHLAFLNHQLFIFIPPAILYAVEYRVVYYLFALLHRTQFLLPPFVNHLAAFCLLNPVFLALPINQATVHLHLFLTCSLFLFLLNLLRTYPHVLPKVLFTEVFNPFLYRLSLWVNHVLYDFNQFFYFEIVDDKGIPGIREHKHEFSSPVKVVSELEV